MAPRKMKQVALKPNMDKSGMKVRVQIKRVKAETRKIKDEQQRIREEQREMTARSGEIQRECEQLREVTQMMRKQISRTQIKVDLMFKILEAQETGDFIEAATLAHFLREFLDMERENASLQVDVKNERP
ncbi:hypothetical protein PTKIN_Ptkin15bG0128200 [Pterospermum kingtungense]